jgi:uncharacterized protein
VDILSKFPFDSLHLGTRPDCLPASTLDYLKILSEKIDLWVELGLQTIHDKTLLRIQREHDWACSLKGIEKLKNKGLQVVSHIILGLPGETKADMIATAKAMAQLPLDGIKIHNLHVVEKTQLAVEYREQPFHLLGEIEYLELVAEFLRHLPPELPIMRINTDTPPKELVAPHWHIQKGQLRERLIRYMEMMDIRQGDLYLGDKGTLSPKPKHQAKVCSTIDNSPTLMCEYHGEPYHPRFGAVRSSQERFIIPAQISTGLELKSINLLDIGFGTGLNTFLALNEALQYQNQIAQQESSHSSTPHTNMHPLHIEAFEQNRRASLSFTGHHHPLEHLDGNVLLHQLQASSQLQLPHGNTLKLHWGDARLHLQGITPNSIDIIFLDPFDEKNNTELVSSELIQWLAHLLVNGGLLLCSRSHPAVLNACLEAGLNPLKSSKNCSGLTARKDSLAVNHLLNQQKKDPRSTPYRDPHLCWSHKDIVRQRNLKLKR